MDDGKKKLNEPRSIRFSSDEIDDIRRACGHLGCMEFKDFVRFAVREKTKEIINSNEDLVDKLIHRIRNKRIIYRLTGQRI